MKFSKYLPKYGWQAVVYTPDKPQTDMVDHTLEADIPAGTEVIRRPILEFYDLYKKLMGKKSMAEVNPINHQKKSLFQRLSLFVRSNFFIPDPRVTWVRPSVAYLREYLKEHPVDAIVSTGPPHSLHLIAQKVSKEFGLPWVADFRDPWTKMYYFKHLSLTKWAERKQYRQERSVLDGCSAVVAVTKMVQAEFAAMTDTPVALITNGFDMDDFQNFGEPVRDGFFNVVHTGLFAIDGNPYIFWKALADKCSKDHEFDAKLRIRLSGKTDTAVVESIKAAGLGVHLQDFGYKTHADAIAEQRLASLLLLPLRNEPEYRSVLPGKLFEYLASCNPILGIGQPDGVMAEVIGETGSGKVCDWDDAEGIAGMIDRAWVAFKCGKSEIMSDKDRIMEYSRDSLSAKMAKLLDSISR